MSGNPNPQDDMTVRDKTVCAFLLGMIAGAALLGLCAMASSNQPKHDPQKLLELRAACLKDDPSRFTVYCDKYAERFSIIEQSPKK